MHCALDNQPQGTGGVPHNLQAVSKLHASNGGMTSRTPPSRRSYSKPRISSGELPTQVRVRRMQHTSATTPRRETTPTGVIASYTYRYGRDFCLYRRTPPSLPTGLGKPRTSRITPLSRQHLVVVTAKSRSTNSHPTESTPFFFHLLHAKRPQLRPTHHIPHSRGAA
jgi:hypothetical protein